MAYRKTLIITVALFSSLLLKAQSTTDELLNEIFGVSQTRPDAYEFSHVIHYDVVQRVHDKKSNQVQLIEGNMDLYFTPGDSAYARVQERDSSKTISVGDLKRGRRYNLWNNGVSKLAMESTLQGLESDTLQMMRVSGDREIQGRMSAHYWFEEGTRIDELWADSESNEMENAIGRLWPLFESGFESLATGTYQGLATRWISIDTKYSRQPRLVLEFKGIEKLAEPLNISFHGYAFPPTVKDMMRERLNADQR